MVGRAARWLALLLLLASLAAAMESGEKRVDSEEGSKKVAQPEAEEQSGESDLQRLRQNFFFAAKRMNKRELQAHQAIRTIEEEWEAYAAKVGPKLAPPEPEQEDSDGDRELGLAWALRPTAGQDLGSLTLPMTALAYLHKLSTDASATAESGGFLHFTSEGLLDKAAFLYTSRRKALQSLGGGAVFPAIDTKGDWLVTWHSHPKKDLLPDASALPRASGAITNLHSPPSYEDLVECQHAQADQVFSDRTAGVVLAHTGVFVYYGLPDLVRVRLADDLATTQHGHDFITALAILLQRGTLDLDLALQYYRKMGFSVQFYSWDAFENADIRISGVSLADTKHRAGFDVEEWVQNYVSTAEGQSEGFEVQKVVDFSLKPFATKDVVPLLDDEEDDDDLDASK